MRTRSPSLEPQLSALRDALEQSRHEGRAAVEDADAHSANEIAQLRQTAQALRENIEGLRHEHREEIQRLIAAAQGEAVQFRAATHPARTA